MSNISIRKLIRILLAAAYLCVIVAGLVIRYIRTDQIIKIRFRPVVEYFLWR